LGKILATIPYDKRVGESIAGGIPYVLWDPKSIITKQFIKLAKNITGLELVFKIEQRKGD